MGTGANRERKVGGTATLDDSLADSAGDPAALRLQRGTSVDRYVVLYELGVGGMGVVYAAYDPELDRKVALKLLHADSRSARARTRLLREAKAIASLSHPNVVTVHDVGTYEGRIFIAMEFIDGVTFRQWIQQSTRTWQEVVSTLDAAGRGLSAAHAADLVHRDFKPDNILVEAGGRVIVLDFGLARRASTGRSKSGVGSGSDAPELEEAPPERTDVEDRDEDQEPNPTGDVLDIHLTRTGARIGTPAYMAPEQHLSAPTDARTDQFSFCVVLWEALYGARPFRGDSPTATAVQVVRGEIQEPPRAQVVPAWIRRAMTKGLSPGPDERHPDMQALLAELGRDPGRRRRQVGLIGIGVVAASVGGWIGLRAVLAEPELCTREQAAARWAPAWDDEREARVRASFMATNLPYAEVTADGVQRAIGEYGQQWVEIYTEACTSTHLLKEQSQELLDLQMTCLRDRRSDTAALVDEFFRADGAVVQNAVEAAASLPRLSACENTRALAERVPIPDDEATRSVVESVTDRLRQARGKLYAGRYAAASELVEQVRRDLEHVDYPPVLADALLLEALVLERRGDFDGAEQRLLEATWTATAAGYDELVAQAWVQLVWVSGVERVDPAQGHRWSKFAAAAIERYGGDEGLRATLIHNTGGVFYRQGRLEEALEHYRRALKAQTSLLGPDDPAVAMTLNHIGNTLMEQGEFAASREYCERSLDLRRKRLGSRHPKVAASLNNLSELFRKKNDAARSFEYATRSLEIVGATGGPEEEVARILASDALAKLQRWEEREEHDRRLLELRRRLRSASDPSVTDATRRLARSLFARGRTDDAMEMLDALLAAGDEESEALVAEFAEADGAEP